MRDDTLLDWTTYLEELERQAIRLRTRRRRRRAAPSRWLAAALAALGPRAAAAVRDARTAVDSGGARG